MSLRNLSRLCCDEYGVEDGDRKLKEEPKERKNELYICIWKIFDEENI